MKVPPRIIAFGWLALHGSILSMDNLRQRNRILANACPMCLADEELVDHLLLRCKVAQALWTSVVRWFGCWWTFPGSVRELFQAWHVRTHSPRGKIMWRSAFSMVIWTIWKERNSRCFEVIVAQEDVLGDSLKFLIASYLSVLPHFQSISIDLIIYRWREVAFPCMMD